jgi:hypothetical protein
MPFLASGVVQSFVAQVLPFWAAPAINIAAVGIPTGFFGASTANAANSAGLSPYAQQLIIGASSILFKDLLRQVRDITPLVLLLPLLLLLLVVLLLLSCCCF